jgi:hypothetical protein
VRSLSDDPVVLPARLTEAVYWDDPEGSTSFILSDIPVKRLAEGRPRRAQVLHVELLWLPKAGATPMDSTATNASIRYVLFSDDQVGVYGGAGFARPHGAPGDRSIRLAIDDASLTLLDSTPGFRDLLSPGRMTGTIHARLDPGTARRLHLLASQHVTDLLGRSRFIRLPAAPANPDGASVARVAGLPLMPLPSAPLP